MMTKEESTKIVNFKTNGAEVFKLGCGHILIGRNSENALIIPHATSWGGYNVELKRIPKINIRIFGATILFIFEI